MITEIGETDSIATLPQNMGLQCITNRMPCCRGPNFKVGDWFFPDGSVVPSQGDALTSFYRNRENNGSVSLNRINSGIIHPTGLFCCVVPDATDVNQTLCINISKLPDISEPACVHLPRAHAHSFYVHNGKIGHADSFPVPAISACISDEGNIPTAGQSNTLTCNVSGDEDLNLTITYQWTKNNGTQTHVGTNSNTLSFFFLRLSDAGQYTCQVNVTSPYLHNVINTASKLYELQIPGMSVCMHGTMSCNSAS